MKITKFLTSLLTVAIVLTSVYIPAYGESEEAEVPVVSEDTTAENKNEAPTEAPVNGAEEVTTEVPVNGAEEVTTEAPVNGAEEVTTEAPVNGAEEVTTEAPVNGAEEVTTEAPVNDAEEVTTEAPAGDDADNNEDNSSNSSYNLGAAYISRLDQSPAADLRIWGEVTGLVGVYLDEFRVEFYTKDGELVATTTLAQKFTCEGSLSWHLRVDGSSDDDWWTYKWVDGNPNPNKVPATAKFIINGKDEGSVSISKHEVFYTKNWSEYFVAEYNGVYYTRLQNVIDAGATNVTLLADVDEAMVTVRAGSNVEIDFNGKTLNGSMLVDKGAVADIKNGNINQPDTVAGIEVQGVVTLTAMNIVSARHAIRVDGLNTEGTLLTVNSGTYQSNAPTGWTAHTINAGEGSTVVIKDGTFIGAGRANAGGSGNCVMVKDADTTVTIEGGKFVDSNAVEGAICPAVKLSISGGSFCTWSYDNYLATDKRYIAVKGADGMYDVLEVTNWIQIADTSWYNENDTEFTLKTAEELAGLAALVNGGNSFKDKTIYLGDNIDLGEFAWTPIGMSGKPFEGSFDGNCCTVSNLTINEPEKSYQALFGYVKGYAEGAYSYISNITLTNVNVTGKNYVAGLVADAFCYDIINCHVNGDIYILNSGNNNYTGAIAGHSYANILNCSVKDTGANGNGYIQGCYSGGIAGWTGEGNYLIENCTVENIDFVEESGTIVGLFNAGVKIKDCVAKNCTINSNTGSGLGYTGLIAGDNRSKNDRPNLIINCTLENVTGQVTVDGAVQELTQLVPAKTSTFIGHDVTLDEKNKVVAGTFTVFNETIASTILADGSVYIKNDDGTYTVIAVSNWIQIADTSWYNENNTEFTLKTAEELAGLAALVNGGNSFKDKTIYLGDNIDLGEFAWTPIGVSTTYCFSGTFYGTGYVISNLNVSAENYAGLFGRVINGKLENITVSGATVTASGWYAGVVVGGIKESDILNCDVTGEIKVTVNYVGGGIVGLVQGTADKKNSLISDCDVSGAVSINAQWYAGGIAGGYGTCFVIENCSVTGSQTKSADVNGLYFVGGILGHNNEGVAISECDVSYAKITAVTGAAGGIAGMANLDNVIMDCDVSNTTVTAPNAAGSIVGGNYGSDTKPVKLYNNISDDVTLPIISNADRDGNVNTSSYPVIIGYDVTLDEKNKVVAGTFTVFNETIASTIIAEGFSYIKNDDGTYTVLKKIAQIDDKYYSTLQAAIDAAKNGDKIVLLVATEITVDHAVAAFDKNVSITKVEGLKIAAPEGYVWVENKLVAVEIDSRVGTIRYYDEKTKQYKLYAFSGIDSLNYKEVGFIVTVGNSTKVLSTSTVYSAVTVNINGTPTKLQASDFSKGDYTAERIFVQGINFDQEYAMNNSITIKSYAVGLDGTVIYGQEIAFETIYKY